MPAAVTVDEQRRRPRRPIVEEEPRRRRAVLDIPEIARRDRVAVEREPARPGRVEDLPARHPPHPREARIDERRLGKEPTRILVMLGSIVERGGLGQAIEPGLVAERLRPHVVPRERAAMKSAARAAVSKWEAARFNTWRSMTTSRAPPGKRSPFRVSSGAVATVRDSFAATTSASKKGTGCA